MALEAPLRSSTGSAMSTFSPHTDMSVSSPDSPSLHSQFVPMSSASSTDSNSLRPSSRANQYLMSPNELVGPSPVTSTGTEVTEIEDEASDDMDAKSPATEPEPSGQFLTLSTNIPEHVRQSLNEEAVSVIHAPESFQSWTASDTSKTTAQPSEKSSPKTEDNSTPSPGSVAKQQQQQQQPVKSPGAPPPISTDVKPARFSVDSATPRAQNLQDVLGDSPRVRSSSSSSLELIPEAKETETDAEAEPEDNDDHDDNDVFAEPQIEEEEDSEIKALKTALQECWTLCNTLASLSTHHRERVFVASGTPDGHERAWKSCWKLCQRLYDNRDEDTNSFNVRGNLDLCRDFCQSLFDIRQRKDETADSVLRVSFELNNHLYSAQDSRMLPEAFRERTLDFYITLCHRLMKQRGDYAVETDSLLRACWSLAEMLFSLRQNRRDGSAPDEELLGSAVQACWELCDIFREGWTQIRPDRGTPRPSQTLFFGHSQQQQQQQQQQQESDGRASRTSNRGSVHSKRESLKSIPKEREQPRKPPPVPETPVTEFEDTPISPDSQSPQVPNILVLGTVGSQSDRGGRWSSSASNLSSYSQSSQRTSSTATTTTSTEDINITRIKTLILKAAMNSGFSRDVHDVSSAKGKSSAASLQSYVKALPTGSFGSLPAHTALLQNYKNLVLADSSFRQASSLPSRGKRVMAADVAKSVAWMMQRSSQYAFLRDLFKLVFGFQVEEAELRKNASIAV